MRPAILLLSGFPLLAAAYASVQAEPTDPVARLIADKTPLAYEPRRGYLDDLLKKLKIDPDSQTLVFSKTSLQSDFINPKKPRAIYFNDETYVGWIPGAPLIEIVTVHPTKGTVFYTLSNDKKATFAREPKECGRCHGVIGPRLFASSSFTAPSGYPWVFSRQHRAVPSTPFQMRWGGWYVTGTHGAQRHMGNELALGDDERQAIDMEKGANVTDLRRYFDVKPYPTPHSDLVALMVMESQMDVQNAISRRDSADAIVEALLGCDEAPLTAPVKGTAGFAARYAATAPKDRQGRSLSELDLKTRLLKYPCSPLVYSPSFDALPASIKEKVWRQMRDVLSGKDPDGRFEHLSAADRKAVSEILRDTKPEFASGG